VFALAVDHLGLWEATSITVPAAAPEQEDSMPNPIVKLWKYLTASANSQIDKRADPKIQIAQAIEAEQQRHQSLANQAAAVLGNQRQLEMRLNRQLGEVEKLQASARQALVLSDKSRNAGDAAKATEYDNAAQVFATQLVAAEQAMEDLKRSHDEALQAAEQARGAVEQSRMRLQTTLAERTKLMSQLEQAKMQEHVAASMRQVNELSAPGNTPSLSEVRDKIEARYANALGQAELAQSSVEGRMLEVEKATLDVAGASRLDQIRAAMSAPAAVEGAPAVSAIEQGAPPLPTATESVAQPAERPESHA
jgi:phage shock protein A